MRIEDWHRVLKSGCKIGELGHHSVERLERAIAICMVIARRVTLMTLLGREGPELPAELLCSDTELRVLGDYARSRRRERPGRLAGAVPETAILGGPSTATQILPRLVTNSSGMATPGSPT
ncbi:hypothetical protein [Ectothiorhodospira variabilis]|uniref:hypothetical protein n=1 Tax=Ectothiorhodospira variabilis TaxID=505694 RepID=UPI001EFB89FD|nr:hypothetical protein [Ectothiorhodospira variabilis]MCG5496009.1 hypothetical protein [Ectothiorhodospira variabilis]MCG5504174.1 hypothetical protein [Ectothiorhodospira variabilis]MCG5507329.1 hypothetical protein [Ectothiorhodospira variabilis]